MNRRNFIGLASTLAAGTRALLLRAAAGSAANQSARPNFLFLIADDLMYRTIHAVNNTEVHTPNIDRLVRRGCHFTHCFHQGSWTGAVCIASRTMLNTGLTAFHAEQQYGANVAGSVPTWGQTLRRAGYRTFIAGKWHLDATSLQRSFSEMSPVAPGFLPSTNDMYNRPSPGNNWDPANRSLLGHWLHTSEWTDAKTDRIEHSSELYADAAIDHLRKAARHEQPFFMYVGFNAPHDPRQAPREFLDMYPPENISIPPNFVPQHPFDQGEAKTRDELPAPFPRTQEAVRLHRREYYAIITHLDSQIGRILDALEASGRAANTYVMLTADHGLAVGEHGLLGKQNQYECSMRMPLIVAGPGIQPGKRVDRMVYQHSMYATTCELAGIPIPEHVEFPSLAPMLRAEKPAAIHDAMFGWLEAVQRSVRTGKHKLIYYPKLDRYQLFDLDSDPWEMHDLAGDAAHAGTQAEMIARLKAMQKQLGDPLAADRSKPPAA